MPIECDNAGYWYSDGQRFNSRTEAEAAEEASRRRSRPSDMWDGFARACDASNKRMLQERVTARGRVTRESATRFVTTDGWIFSEECYAIDRQVDLDNGTIRPAANRFYMDKAEREFFSRQLKQVSASEDMAAMRLQMLETARSFDRALQLESQKVWLEGDFWEGVSYQAEFDALTLLVNFVKGCVRAWAEDVVDDTVRRTAVLELRERPEVTTR